MEVVIEAALAMPDGTEVVLDSDPLFVAFDQAYATATVAAELDGFEASGELTIRAMATATGRIRGDRGWEPTAAFATSVRPETAVPLPFPDGPTENAQDGYTRFCPKWRVSYDDPNPSQDFLHVSGTQSVPARYASTTVSRNGTVRWSGYLDANGCTPYIYLSSGTYDIALTTALNDANGSTDGSVIVRRSQSDPTIGTAGASVAITQGLSNASYDVNTLVNSRHTRAAALASHFMSIADLRMWRRSLTIYVDQNCAQSAGCASASWIKVGTNYVGTDMTRIRHVVAHEYGHTVQANSFGLMAASYDTVDSPNPMCSCDHVTESNNLHCLQSAETLPAAINEGYAHFIAAIAFNRTATNCSFSYYKSVLIGSLGENEPAIVGPPYAVNCSAAVRWMETNDCVQSHAGTEWDWLTFLWDLRVGEFNGFGMTDIYWMFRLSCDPDHSDWGNPCGVGDLYWSELATQMNAWTSLYRDEFFRAANAHGVDH